MTFSPPWLSQTQSQPGHKISRRTFSRIMTAFSPYRLQGTLVLVAILLTTLLGLVNPILVQHVFDDAIGKRNLSLLIIYVAVMFCIPFISGIIGIGQTYLNNTIGQNVMRDFRNQLYAHLQQMSLRFFTTTRTGEIQSRLSNDVSGVQVVVTNTATNLVSNLATVFSVIIAMALLSPFLTLVSLAILPIFIWLTYKAGNVRREVSAQTQQSMASLTAIMSETLSVNGILLVKTFGRQHYAQQQFEQENQQFAALAVRQQMIGQWLFMLTGIFFTVTPALVYLIAGWQIVHEQPLFGVSMTIGTIASFTALQGRLFFPINQLLALQVQVQGAFALFDRIFEYLDLPVDITEKPTALHLHADAVRGEVTYTEVSFAYKSAGMEKPATFIPPFARKPMDVKPFAIPNVTHTPEADKPTLQNISFKIKPGQLAALVGPSGAGKTTITYLLPRLYEVDSGSVAIDGHDVKDLSFASLSELVGVVTQETYLFHASIRANLLYARPDAMEQELIAAAQAAAIHDRIMELEAGYDTIVGERGYKLSGGEKQRLAIARLILKDPPILILDEATSALDTHSERLIQAALEPLMKRRTTLAIAHRLSTILNADLILVVDHGKIVEQGTHEELLREGKLYAQLYAEQFSKPPQ